MPETPARQKAEAKRLDVGGPQLRRELAQAAATLELSELETSNAHVGELLEITFAIAAGRTASASCTQWPRASCPTSRRRRGRKL